MDHESLVPRHFSYDVLKEITDGFSDERVLGSGGYGKVYLGVQKDGKKIAVKVLYETPGLDDDQFKRELSNLTTLQHHNIVRLVGYCHEAQQECVQHDGRLVTADRIYRALCFDYMPNKSVAEHLFDEYNGHDWHTRYGMINGISDGLKYLHEDLKPPIYHLDLKPANILLDENMIAKIADFGLSRLFGEELTRVTHSPLMGTPGYLPPEYINMQVISRKFDVFSLGVVIIKIMAGPDGYSKSAEMSPHEFIELVHANWRNRLQDTFTPVCAVESYCEQVRICIETALRCRDADRHKRPSIGDIVNNLNKTEIVIQNLSQFLCSLPNDDPVSSVDQAESVIQKWPYVNHQDFLDALDQLRNIEHFFSSNRSYSCSYEVLSRVNALLLKALVKMESQFKNLLSQSRKPVERDHLFDCLPSRFRPSPVQFPPEGEKNPSTSAQSENQEHSAATLIELSLPKGEKQPSAGAQSANQESPEADVYIPPSLIDPTFIPLLAKLAEQLVQAGYQQQCAKIYGEARASALESSLKNLGVEKLSKTQVKLLFAGERLLCNQVFEWNQSLADKCIAAITENSLAMLLRFGEAMAMGERSPFLLLDMYEIICELQAEIDTIFVGKSCSQMHEAILSLRKCLVQSLQKAFIYLEEAIENDTSELENDGTVHLLTSNVIHILMCLFDSRSTFEQLFQEVTREDGTCYDMTAVTMSVVEALQKKLDARAKEYKDQALMHIFLMNNNNYIVSRSQEYKDLLGEDWIQRHQRIAQKNADDYIRLAWPKVLRCLSIQDSSSSDPSTSAAKERLKSFNTLLQEICQKQSCWSVPDAGLRESLRRGIAEILLPAYESFLFHFGPLIDNSKASGKYVKLTPEQLEQLLGDLFAGKQEPPPAPGHSWLVSGIRKLMQFPQKMNEDHAPQRKVEAERKPEKRKEERKPEKRKEERKPERTGYAVYDPIGGARYYFTD